MKLKTEIRPQIVVIGGAHMEIVLRANEPATAHGAITTESTDIRPGGRAACMAAALSRLRARVTMVSCLGTDPFASQILTELSTQNINLDYIRRSAPHFTGMVHHIIMQNGVTRRFYTPGASMQLTVDAVKRASVSISAADLVLITSDIPKETLTFAIELAHHYKSAVLLDPDPPTTVGEKDVALCDIVAPEAAAAAGLCGWNIVSSGDAQRCAARLLGMGAGAAVLHLGAKGTFSSTDTDAVTYTPAPSGASFSHPNSKAAFNAGLAWALAMKYSLPDAVWMAQSCAAGVRPYDECRNAFDVFPDIDRLIEAQLIEIR